VLDALKTLWQSTVRSNTSKTELTETATVAGLQRAHSSVNPINVLNMTVACSNDCNLTRTRQTSRDRIPPQAVAFITTATVTNSLWHGLHTFSAVPVNSPFHPTCASMGRT